jgi:transposase InsO family protein
MEERQRRSFPEDYKRQAVDLVAYVETDQGWLYLAVVMDLYSRKIVGWAMADHLRADLPLATLRMAISAQRPGARLIHHLDRDVHPAARFICPSLRRPDSNLPWRKCAWQVKSYHRVQFLLRHMMDTWSIGQIANLRQVVTRFAMQQRMRPRANTLFVSPYFNCRIA